MKISRASIGSIRKREVSQPQQHTEYYLFNSQSNLKAYSDDIMSFAYYGYNAANTRAYKLSLYNTNIWINGQQEPLNMQLQQAMFYPNTYLNFNGNGEYTKHYYNGTERIASRLGDNTTTIALNNNILEDRKLSLEEHFRVDIHKLIYETVLIDLPPFIDVNALQPTGTPNDIYYYHPNHLGSTSFVTDQNQTITQGFLYAPFGEITTEYNINFGNNVIPKYSFNAKEFDEETGMFYYEARYYAPPVFTSRDAMFEKYFWMSPYTYCANNPVKYVDPSGEETWEPDKYGNLIAEDGDNAEELSKCMGISFEKASELLVAQGYSTENVPKGSVLKLDNAFTRDLAKHGDIPTQDYRDENSPLYYNCWGSAITGTQNRIITAGKNGCGIDFPVEFDNDLLTDYENVDFSKSILGKTIIRFEDTHPYENSNFNNICEIGYVSRTPGEVGSASHGAVYYGTSRNGTVYVYSKNGWGAPPVICPLKELVKIYGSVKGIGGQSGYYNHVN